MPEKSGKRDNRRTARGCEIPVPKRDDVMHVFSKAAKKKKRLRSEPDSENKPAT